MLEAFTRNGELRHWTRKRDDPQLERLQHRHRQIAVRIKQLCNIMQENLVQNGWESVLQEMRGLCVRLLSIEREYWQRTGNQGLPPTFELQPQREGPAMVRFATTRSVKEILDESFLSREELGGMPKIHLHRDKTANAQTILSTTEEQDVGSPPDPDDELNLHRFMRLQGLLQHHGRDEAPDADHVDRSDALWQEEATPRTARGDWTKQDWRDSKKL